MQNFRLTVLCLIAFLTSCLSLEDKCSRLDMLETLLEKMVRTQLNFEQLESNVGVVHSKMDIALKSTENKIEILENNMQAFEEVVGEKLKVLNEQLNDTSAVTRKLAELGISVDDRTTTCPDGWMSFQGSCYYFGSANHPFADAQRLCEEQQAGLVNIETARENNFLRSHLRELKAAKHWVGMTDEAEEGAWKYYPSGTPVTFFEWGARQPNNGRVSNCMAIWESFGYLWVDEPCTNRFRPICEKKASV